MAPFKAIHVQKVNCTLEEAWEREGQEQWPLESWRLEWHNCSLFHVHDWRDLNRDTTVQVCVWGFPGIDKCQGEVPYAWKCKSLTRVNMFRP